MDLLEISTTETFNKLAEAEAIIKTLIGTPEGDALFLEFHTPCVPRKHHLLLDSKEYPETEQLRKALISYFKTETYMLKQKLKRSLDLLDTDFEE